MDWTEFQAQSADNRTISVRLSPDSLTLLLSGVDGFIPRSQWRYGDTTPVSDADWDTIDAMIAKAATELMTNIFTGTIFPFATASPPEGALECDGATYLRVDYPDLYAILDSAFIVDADNFILPDLRGRTLIGVGSSPPLSTYGVGDTGGEEAHQLTTAELAAHSHGVTDAGHVHSEGIAIPNITSISVGVPTPTALPSVGVTGLAFTGVSINNAGADTAHENRQPYLALRFGIWV